MSPVLRSTDSLRTMFEVERAFLRTFSTLIPRVGDLELKYVLCEQLWESAQHARFLRERGRELAGFGNDDSVRPEIDRVFEEAIRGEDELETLAAFALVLKGGLRSAYRHYLDAADSLADWPTRNLIEGFLEDEERHADEIAPWISASGTCAWVDHVRATHDELGGWLGERDRVTLPPDFGWVSAVRPYVHPQLPSRGAFPLCSDAQGDDPDEVPVVRPWLVDPTTDARVIRVMIYVWLFNEADAVDYLPTIFYDTPTAPFDFHFDLARHVWDESRHSQFGFRQLPRLGVDLAMLEQQVLLYDVLVRLRPHERYVLVTHCFEAGSFDVKASIMDRVRELSDFESDTLLAFDRTDEQNHVRFGHRWLPTLLELMGDDREPKAFAAATLEKFEDLRVEASVRLGHDLPPSERLTGSRIAELVAAAS